MFGVSNKKGKRPNVFKMFFLLFCLCILLCAIVLTCRIARDAKTCELNNQTITWSYDSNNNVGNTATLTNLVTSEYLPVSVEHTDRQYYVRFEKTYFGTIEIVFSEPLDHDVDLTITFSEKALDDHAWTRQDMTRELRGFGIAYCTVNCVAAKGSEVLRVELPVRPLPTEELIEGGWNGGVIPFCCCTVDFSEDIIVSEKNFKQIAVHVDFDDEAGMFISDNQQLNDIYTLCKDTVKATSYAGIYVDGYRELQPYEADAYINELSHFSVDDNYEMARNTLIYFVDNHTWPTEWVLMTIPLAYEYYMYSGDEELIRAVYPKLQQCLLQGLKNESGLIDSSLYDASIDSVGIPVMRDIIDWPEIERDGFSHSITTDSKDILAGMKYGYSSFVSDSIGCYYTGSLYKILCEGSIEGQSVIATPNSVVNAYYYYCLNLMADLSGYLNENSQAEIYRKEAELFKSIYIGTFYDAESGLIMDDVAKTHTSLHSNMFALDFGLVPEEALDTVIGYMKVKGMTCSVYGSQFLLESLFKHAEDAYALNLITDTGTRSWSNMISNGSGLTTEAWDESIKPDMDWNHAWGTAPINIITRYVVGVRPYSPGCEMIVIEPHFGNLSSIQATVPINGGEVHISYSLDTETGMAQLTVNSPKDFLLNISEFNSYVELDDGDNNIESYAGVRMCSGEHIITYNTVN